MTHRVTVALSLFVDLKVDEGADIKNVINSLSCNCVDTTGEATIVAVDIQDRKLVVDIGEELDEE